MSLYRFLLLIISITTAVNAFGTKTTRRKTTGCRFLCISCSCVEEETDETLLDQDEAMTPRHTTLQPTKQPLPQSQKLTLVDLEEDDASSVATTDASRSRSSSFASSRPKTPKSPQPRKKSPRSPKSPKPRKASRKRSESSKDLALLQAQISQHCQMMISLFPHDDLTDITPEIPDVYVKRLEEYCIKRFGSLLSGKHTSDSAKKGPQTKVVALDLETIVSNKVIDIKDKEELSSTIKRMQLSNSADAIMNQKHIIRHGDTFKVHFYRNYFMEFIEAVEKDIVTVYAYLDSDESPKEQMQNVLSVIYDLVLLELQYNHFYAGTAALYSSHTFQFRFVSFVTPSMRQRGHIFNYLVEGMLARKMKSSLKDCTSFSIIDTIGKHSITSNELSDIFAVPLVHFSAILVEAAPAEHDQRDQFWSTFQGQWHHKALERRIQRGRHEIGWTQWYPKRGITYVLMDKDVDN